MARAPSKVRHSDVRKALRAFQQAGLLVGRVEIEPETGKITVFTDAPEDPTLSSEARADRALTKWLAQDK